MDPLSAFSLAGTVIQFVHFSCDLISKTTEVSRSASGQLQENIEIDQTAKDLSLLCAKIQTGLVGFEGNHALSELAISCQNVADEITMLIAKIGQKHGDKRKWSSFRQALKTILRKEEIQSLHNRLYGLRSQMNTQLLTTLGAQNEDIRRMLQNLLSERLWNPIYGVQQPSTISPVENRTPVIEPDKNDRIRQKRIMDIVNRTKSAGNGKIGSDTHKQFEDLLEELTSNVEEAEESQGRNRNHPGISTPQFEPHFGLNELANEIKSIETCQNASKNRDFQIREALQQSTSFLPPPDADDVSNWAHTIKIAGMVNWASKSMGLLREQKILDSLRFDNMELRRDSIPQAHSSTFKWLFKPNDSVLKPTTSLSHMQATFIRWLQDSDNTYWIGGKPGSGKSTLMKHILDDEKTRQNLEKWSAGEQLHMAGYFFWHRGCKIQRSQQGLLQSLLFTILEATPGLAEGICPSRMINPRPSWTLSELKTVFANLGRAQLSGSKFCFFIDGLDEYSGDHFELVELLQTLSRSPRFKICLASRPWPCFEDAFGQDPAHRLYLQDLTKPDIEIYARESLDRAKDQSLSMGEMKLFEQLIDEVVQKSQGVFLWVTLVVRSLREGLANGDSIMMLKKRVNDFPADLEPFFEALIRSVDPMYRIVMAKTFLVALETQHLPVVALSFIEEDWDYALRLRTEAFAYKEIIKIQTKMRRRVNGRYKGLIECWKDYNGYGYNSLVVEFLHRTVRDFLKTAPIQKMLTSEVDELFDVELLLGRIHLAQLKTRPLIPGLRTPTKALNQFLHLSGQHQSRTEKCDYEALEELGQVLKERSEITIKTDAEYLGLLARKGLSVYIQAYLSQNTGCSSSSLGFSPIMFLLNRKHGDADVFRKVKEGIDLDDGDNINKPQEVLKMVKILSDAGYPLKHDDLDICCWALLVKYVMEDDSKVPGFLRGILSPLLDLCISRGASFSDLITGENRHQWVRDFVRSIRLGSNNGDVSPLELLEKLFAQGLAPMECHKSIDNASLWSLILDDIKSPLDGRRELSSPVDVLCLCLRYGAPPDELILLQLLDKGNLGESEEERLRNMVRNAEGQNNSNTKWKWKWK